MRRASHGIAALIFAVALPAFAQSAQAEAVDCKALEARIERTEQARRAAQDDSDNAWKAVVPFVVLARKASAKAALEDAGKQLAALKAQAASACPHAPSSSFI